MSVSRGPTRSPEPFRVSPVSSNERPRSRRAGARRRRLHALGRVRLPLAGPYRPWARLYRLPDGRAVWLVRLWEVDRPRTHLVPTSVLLAFARLNRLPALADEIRRLAASAAGPDGA
jgi:hypothetical protein